MKRFVICSERDGVYIGSAMGLGFWSLLDPVGQEAAVTFESVEQAKEVMATWECVAELGELRLVEVEADVHDHYASVASCVAAGLPAWDPNT
jgi:hypothetical protein